MQNVINPIGILLIKNKINVWEYDINFIDWLKNNCNKFSSESELTKYLDTYNGFIKKICKQNNIELEYNYGKTDPRFKAIYQDYNWCYQKYVIEGLNHNEMAKEAGCSKRVIEKWCQEKHQLTQKYRQENKTISLLQKDLIIGSMLGDGHIDKRETQPVFIVSHAENQKDYLYYKYEILKDLCSKEPSYIEGGEREFKIGIYECQPGYRICTRIYDAFKEYRNKSYTYFLNLMNEYSLSIWILDDGFRAKSNWQLCVAEYTQDDIKCTLDILKNKYNIIGWQNKDIRYLTFDAPSSRKIDEIILNNILNDLDVIKYKITENNISQEQKFLYVQYKNKNVKLHELCKELNLDYKYVWQKLYRGGSIEEVMKQRVINL